MGAWAEGNFDNDSALDLVADVAKNVAQEMRPPTEVEDIDLLMAAVEIRMALVEHCHAAPPERTEIESLQDAVVSIYDEQIDGLDPAPDYKTGRRRTIVETFERFLRLLDKARE